MYYNNLKTLEVWGTTKSKVIKQSKSFLEKELHTKLRIDVDHDVYKLYFKKERIDPIPLLISYNNDNALYYCMVLYDSLNISHTKISCCNKKKKLK